MPAESTQESQARRWKRAREEGHPKPEERVRSVDISEKPRERSISLWAGSLSWGWERRNSKCGPRQKTGVGACNEIEGRDLRR